MSWWWPSHLGYAVRSKLADIGMGARLFARLVALFGPRAQGIQVQHKHFNFRYRSAAHFVQVLRDFYGPMHKAFGALDAHGQAALERDITALMAEFDVGGGRGLVVPGEYAEIVITTA